MNDEITKIAKDVAAGIDLSNFGGDVVIIKHVEQETNIAEGGIGVQNNYYYQSLNEDAPSRDERIVNAINKMVDECLIVEKQHFAAIFQILREKRIYENLSQQAFVNLLSKRCNLQRNLIPDRSLLSKVVISGKFPDWRINDSNPDKNNEMMQIAQSFLDYYQG